MSGCLSTLLPPAGDPSRRGRLQGEAESPDGRRYENQRWCVTTQSCEAGSPDQNLLSAGPDAGPADGRLTPELL